MKTLIIPDVHHRIERADLVIEREKDANQIVFLGDIYDDFGDTPLIAGKTARWHKRMLERDDVVFCMGNHDMPYRFRNPFLGCSGWEWPKHQAIAEVVKPEDWDKHVLFVDTQGWLLSHAGVNSRFYKGAAEFLRDCNQAVAWAREGKRPMLLGAGYYRGGDQAVGGITWQDWDGEFEADAGLRQIVGHTPHKEPQSKVSVDGCENWDLDTHSRHYGIIQDGELEVRKV